MWLGGGVSQQASFIAAFLKQRTSLLKVKHIKEANKLLKQLKALPNELLHRKRYGKEITVIYYFSDPSFSINAEQEYGQTGVIVGIIIPSDTPHVYHIMDLSCQQQRIISQ